VGLRSTAAARFEGGGVEGDGDSTTMTKSLRKRIVAACSEARVEVAACSGVGDEVAPCSGAEIEDDMWRRRRGGF
jgi:hypothetical protein